MRSMRVFSHRSVVQGDEVPEPDSQAQLRPQTSLVHNNAENSWIQCKNNRRLGKNYDLTSPVLVTDFNFIVLKLIIQ